MNKVMILLGMLAMAGSAHAQLTVEKKITVDKNVPDNGVLRTGFTWSGSGISVIDSVSVSLNVSSPFASNPINLNDLSGSIRHGLSTETYKTGSLFSAGQMTSLSQTFTQASALDGNWLPSNYWRLDLADGRGGGIAELDNFTFSVTGTAANSGSLDVGQGGKIKASGAGTQAIGANVNSSGSGANAVGLEAEVGKTLQLNGGLQGSGEFKAEAGGNVKLNAAADGFSGKVTVNAGLVEVANSSALGTGSLEVASGAALKVAAGVTLSNAVAVTGTNKVALSGGSSSSDVSTISGVISGTGGLEKTGAGTVEIVGTNTFTGATDVNAGKLVVNGDISSSSKTTVASGGTLGGSGTVGALEVASGGTLAVGNSPGQLNAGNTVWAGGASLAWEVDDSTGNDNYEGSPFTGKGTNWDFLNVTGTLNITATSGSQFIIDVISLLNGTNSGGSADGFAPGTPYTFAIATASGGIQIGGTGIGGYASESAFNSALLALFDINTTWFANNPGSDGLWSISTSSGGTNLLLSYAGSGTAIPEPSSASMLVLGLAALLAKRRRAKRG